jgi:ADP-ribosyl-[dinitrogen reductase] hydrolase
LISRTKFRGAILGTAIGDALGAPMETMWAKDIAENFPHFTIDSIDYVSSLTDQSRGVGRWTDDTQLMIPTAWSIIYNGDINVDDIAQAYADVYMKQRRRGWGRSTTQSLQRVAEGVPWQRAADGSLGTGNGPAMKAAPLGLFLAAMLAHNDYTAIKKAMLDIVDVGSITHQDKGIRAGLLQSVLVALAIHSFSPSFMLDALHHSELALFKSDPFSKKVVELCELSDIPSICSVGGVTSKAEESWCSTAAVFLKYCHQKSACMPVLVELIQQGGDTDTTGAMLGSLIGAAHGELVFPKRLRIRLEDTENIVTIGDRIYEALGGTKLESQRTQFSFIKLA